MYILEAIFDWSCSVRWAHCNFYQDYRFPNFQYFSYLTPTSLIFVHLHFLIKVQPRSQDFFPFLNSPNLKKGKKSWERGLIKVPSNKYNTTHQNADTQIQTVTINKCIRKYKLKLWANFLFLISAAVLFITMGGYHISIYYITRSARDE